MNGLGLVAASLLLLSTAPRGRLGLTRGSRRTWRSALGIGVLAGIPLAVALLGSPLSVSALVIMVVAGSWLVRDFGRRRNEKRINERDAELLGHLAANLRAGLTPERALAQAQAALDKHGEPPIGLGPLWRAAEYHGISLAPLVEQLQSRVDTRLRHRAVTMASLTGPQSTAIVLSLLPLAGLGLGSGLGAEPGAFLLSTTLGGVVLNAGVGLIAAGLLWSRQIMNSAGRP